MANYGVMAIVGLFAVLLTWRDFTRNGEATAKVESDDMPVPKLKNQFAVPVIKFLVCQS